MEAVALYLFKVHIAIALLYGVYYLTVRKELFFRLNRFILLGILLLSFSLPLLPSFSLHLSASTGAMAGETGFKVQDLASSIKGKEVAKLDDEIDVKRLSGIVTSLLSFYLCGVAFFLWKFFGQISNVLALIRSADKVEHGQYSYLDPGENIPAFSFFNSIVISRHEQDPGRLKQIIAHEQAHVNQMHSVDIIAAELASVLLWGNPFAKALKTEVRMNLEFLADQEVLSRGFDKKSYQWSIISPYLQQNAFPLTNLYSSKPKQRIERMNAGRRPLLNICKYLLLLPIVAFLYTGLAPLHASVLDKIHTMKLIDDHSYRDYLGYYEFDRDKGSFVKITMKDETLIMNTLWNNKKIFFQKRTENTFVSTEAGIPLAFPKDYEGAVKGLVAFGDDQWTKVHKYIPVKKKSGEGTVISRTSSGGMQVLVYAIEPWASVRHYSDQSAVSSP